MRDPYEVLRISRNASDEEIKKAYRAASRKYHPDANLNNPKQAEEKFKEVQQAYKEIVKERSGGGTSQRAGSYGGTGQGNYGSYQSGQSGSQGNRTDGAWDFGDFDFGGFRGFGDSEAYKKRQESYGTPDFIRGDLCFKLCMLNMLCNCCCGGGGFCCGSPYGYR